MGSNKKTMIASKCLKEISDILTSREKHQWYRSMVAVCISTLLDFFSLASLLPLLYFLMEGSGNQKAAIVFGVIAISFIAVKSISGIWLQRYRSRYLIDLFNRLSLTLYQENFHKGIVYVKNHGTGRIGYEITWVCHSFCNNILGTLMRMTGDILLLILIGGVVFIMAPISALSLCFPLITVALAYNKLINKKARKAGEKELEGRRCQTRVINDTFGGYADVAVTGAYDSFEHDFKQSLLCMSDSRLKVDLYNRGLLPLCELAVAVALATLAFIGTSNGTKMAIGLFAVAAFRVIPAIRGLIWGCVQIKNASPTLEILKNSLPCKDTRCSDYSYTNKKDVSDIYTQSSTEPFISIQDVSFAYPDDTIPVLKNFSLKINRGDYVGIRGESGIGKSTLFSLILGFIVPDFGSIDIYGVPISRIQHNSWLKHVGYVPQEVYVFNASVVKNVAPGVKNPDRNRILKIIREVHLEQWLESLPNGLDTILGERGQTMSGGERQRLGIARSLYREISLLLLDEATSALDPTTETGILETIDSARINYNLTVISIAHRPSSLNNCNIIVDLSKQNI